MNYEVAIEMQRICTGETRELSRGQIAGEVIELEKLTRGFKPERAERCAEFYNEMLKDDEKRMYDADRLVAETESIKAEFEEFINKDNDDVFQKLYDDIEGFFKNPPFEGLDNIEYGIHEVCVFSILEYFLWKTWSGHDHDKCRQEYRDSIARRTYEEVGDHWIAVYDNLQRRYDKLDGDVNDEYSLKVKLAGCCIIAIAAIRDQDDFSLDMAQAGAAGKAKEIVDSNVDETNKDSEGGFTGNVLRLFAFVYSHIREFRQEE